MTKRYSRTISVLAFCSAFIDFLIETPSVIIYPRDRVIHIIISAAVFMSMAYLINIINFTGVFFKTTIFLLLSLKTIFLVYRFSEYFRIFYGSSTAGIVILTVSVFIMTAGIKDKSLEQIGGFYIAANLIFILLLIITSNRMDAINIYSPDKSFEYSSGKLFLFFDIVTLAAVSSDRKTKLKIQKHYIMISSVVFILITLLQGLSIRGELLYSLSPLQSLLQILSGNTIKRYDYIFNLLVTFNYFGAVIMYSIVMKKVLYTEKISEKN